MHRRVASLVVALVSALLLATVPAAVGLVTPDLVLAAEGGASEPPGGASEGDVGAEEPLGLEPAPATASGNPAAVEEYEPNFLWGAAVGLMALVGLTALAVGGLYLLLVLLPRRKRSST